MNLAWWLERSTCSRMPNQIKGGSVRDEDGITTLGAVQVAAGRR